VQVTEVPSEREREKNKYFFKGTNKLKIFFGYCNFILFLPVAVSPEMTLQVESSVKERVSGSAVVAESSGKIITIFPGLGTVLVGVNRIV